MKIEFLGHATFFITTKDNIRIITDPYESGGFGGTFNYKPIDVEADIVTISHSHSDHADSQAVKGRPIIIDKIGKHYVKGINIEGLVSYHDKNQGGDRGSNIIFVIEADGMKLAHLGDLGCEPSSVDIEKLREIDVIFIPVGGRYTIDSKEAKNLVDILKPRIAIPMHFKTEAVGLSIDSASKFVKEFDKGVTKEEKASVIEIDKNNLPSETTVITFVPSRL